MSTRIPQDRAAAFKNIISEEEYGVIDEVKFVAKTLLCKEKLVILRQCAYKHNITVSSPQEKKDRYCGREFIEMVDCCESIEDFEVNDIVNKYGERNCKNEKYLLEECQKEHGADSPMCDRKLIDFSLCGGRALVEENISMLQ